MSRWWFLLLVPAVVEVWFAFVLYGWYDALNRRSKRLDQLEGSGE